MTPGQKDMLTYAGMGVIGTLIARSVAKGLVGSLIGGVGGIAVAAWFITHPPKHDQTTG